MLVTHMGPNLPLHLILPHPQQSKRTTTSLWVFKHIHYFRKLNKFVSFIYLAKIHWIPYYIPAIVLGIGDTEERNTKTKGLFPRNSSSGKRGRNKQICQMVMGAIKKNKARMRIKNHKVRRDMPLYTWWSGKTSLIRYNMGRELKQVGK